MTSKRLSMNCSSKMKFPDLHHAEECVNVEIDTLSAFLQQWEERFKLTLA